MDVPKLRRALREEGFLVRADKASAGYLKGYDFRPDVVFDVGVHQGTPFLYKTFPDTKFVLVDPKPEAEEAVRGSGLLKDFDFHATALGAGNERAVLEIPTTEPGKGGAMASLMERKDHLKDTFTSVERRDVDVVRLDDIAKEYPGSVGLKIDTEGYELNILNGGPETLKRCVFVILEMSVTERFANLAAPSVMIDLLAKAGLEFRDVLAVSHAPGKYARPRHFDILFTRWSA